jgi:beta-glucosidase-like glycosyl hydrolase
VLTPPPPPPPSVTEVPFDTINSREAQANNLEAARQGLVLLQNPGSILPLTTTSSSVGPSGVLSTTTSAVPTIALIGPHSRTQKTLAGNYFEDIGLGTCSGPSCIPTIEASLNTASAKVGGTSNVTTVESCSDMKCATADINAAVAAAKAAEVQSYTHTRILAYAH